MAYWNFEVGPLHANSSNLLGSASVLAFMRGSYSTPISIPRDSNPSLWAATSVVPLPRKGSSTVPFLGDEFDEITN